MFLFRSHRSLYIFLCSSRFASRHRRLLTIIQIQNPTTSNEPAVEKWSGRRVRAFVYHKTHMLFVFSGALLLASSACSWKRNPKPDSSLPACLIYLLDWVITTSYSMADAGDNVDRRRRIDFISQTLIQVGFLGKSCGLFLRGIFWMSRREAFLSHDSFFLVFGK